MAYNSFLIELLRIVLDNNYFNFSGRHFHQIAGTEMGTKLTPSYATLFMSHFEDKYAYTYPLQPFLSTLLQVSHKTAHKALCQTHR